jgi:hypothetical protein
MASLARGKKSSNSMADIIVNIRRQLRLMEELYEPLLFSRQRRPDRPWQSDNVEQKITRIVVTLSQRVGEQKVNGVGQENWQGDLLTYHQTQIFSGEL